MEAVGRPQKTVCCGATTKRAALNPFFGRRVYSFLCLHIRFSHHESVTRALASRLHPSAGVLVECLDELGGVTGDDAVRRETPSHNRIGANHAVSPQNELSATARNDSAVT
jgi:hypothetical protein